MYVGMDPFGDYWQEGEEPDARKVAYQEQLKRAKKIRKNQRKQDRLMWKEAMRNEYPTIRGAITAGP